MLYIWSQSLLSLRANFSRCTFFLPTENWQFLHCCDISALISHDTKTWCLLKPLHNRLFDPSSKGFYEVNPAPREVYVAFLDVFSMKTCNSLSPQDTTKSTNWVKFVEWAMTMGEKVCALYKWFHCSSILSLLHLPFATAAQLNLVLMWVAGFDWLLMWRALLSWAFIFSTVFFQFWKALRSKPSLCAVCGCLQWSVYKLGRKHHRSYTSQLKSFSQFFEYFLLLINGRYFSLQGFLGEGSAVSESKSDELDSVLLCEL